MYWDMSVEKNSLPGLLRPAFYPTHPEKLNLSGQFFLMYTKEKNQIFTENPPCKRGVLIGSPRMWHLSCNRYVAKDVGR